MTAALRTRPARSTDFGGWTLWSRDGVAVVMPTPDPTWPAALEALYLMRVEANLTGRCPSCLSEDVALAGVAPGQARGALTHETDCPVADDRLAAAVRS